MKDKYERKRREAISAIDLFCGAGALTYGLAKAGIDVRLGVDNDPACEYPFAANNTADFLLKSVTDISGRDLGRFFKKGTVRLLAGCAPCQTFSSYYQKAKPTDSRWWLLNEFSRLVEEVAPELVTMENVPGLRDQDVFRVFEQHLSEQDYHISHQIVDCFEYGVPQHRRRLVLLASKLGPIELLTPERIKSKSRTVRTAIESMPPLEAGQIDSKDPLHRCSALSPLNLKRIRSSRPGGTWRDWENDIVADCHKKSTGRTYPGVYGRMSWDEPAPTITTQYFGFGNGRFGHPEQDRAISLREGAMLQGFPKKYKFARDKDEIHMKTIGRLVGNAVPVRLGFVIGRSIIKHAEQYG